MPRQTSIQVTEATRRQADELTAGGWGSFTDIVRTAIDRMHREERKTKTMYTEQDVIDANFAERVRNAMLLNEEQERECNRPVPSQRTLLLNAIHDLMQIDNYDYAAELRQFERGQALLAEAQLVISHRYRRGTVPAEMPGRVDSPVILIPAGHIATDESFIRIGLAKRS